MSLKFCEWFVINEDDFTTEWKAWGLSVFVQESDAIWCIKLQIHDDTYIGDDKCT